MGKVVKYTEEYIDLVEKYLSEGNKISEAIRLAGFTDRTLFYKCLKRYNRVQQIKFVKHEISDKSIFM